jgi:hypothetical protein
MRRGNRIICGLIIFLALLLSQTQNTSVAIHSDKKNKIITLIDQIKGEKQDNLPDITIKKFDVWYVIEKINENDSLITQGIFITVFNIGNKKTNGYTLTLKVYAIWPDHELLVMNVSLPAGILGTGFSRDISEINLPSLEKPLQYRAEVTTGLQEENYENNNMTIICKDGFRISGSIHLNFLARLIAGTMPLIIVIEDVNPRYSINRTKYDDFCFSPYEYNFTAPLQESRQQVRAFISPYAVLGEFFPDMKLPILCHFFSKAKEIGVVNPNQHVIININLY